MPQVLSHNPLIASLWPLPVRECVIASDPFKESKHQASLMLLEIHEFHSLPERSTNQKGPQQDIPLLNMVLVLGNDVHLALFVH